MKFSRTLISFTSLDKNTGYPFQGVPACPPSHVVNKPKVIQSFKNLIIAHILQPSTEVDSMPEQQSA